jgi:hypothetical protein
VTGKRTIALLALVVAALLCIGSAATSAASPVSVTAPDGKAGGQVGTDHGSDQGEDQGENIDQFARGTKKIGPVTVSAVNSTTAGPAHGGAGGDVVVTFENRVTTTCGAPAPRTIPLPETVQATAGNGGKGGKSGTGQGADQGEDQGENIGQHAFVRADVSPVSVSATSTNTSGGALGGKGGDVSITFHTITTCVPAGTTSQAVAPAPPSVTQDAQGNIRAVYSAVTTCDGTAPQPYIFRAGNGGDGGSSALDQGSDQGEDQGENIGMWASGSARGGPARVHARNTLVAAGAVGGKGGSITVTFDNTIDLACASATPTLASDASVVATAGTGGQGGQSGVGQGSDQGEDQGENIGKDAKDGARIGPVSDVATNLNVSGATSGGDGGNVDVIYADEGTCAAAPAAQPDERVNATAGTGGEGGESGSDQGSDQGEDQGENIGQFARGHASFSDVLVRASNTNRAGVALGGDGGHVNVGYEAGSCAPAASSRGETVTANAGTGGAGGQSGHDQGADQGEDQGENIGQHAGRGVTFGKIRVAAVNLNVSGDVIGGKGGDVTVHSGTPTCSTPASSPDARVRGQQRSGGAGGVTGKGQGSDQGEDQGENIGNRAQGGTALRSHTTVTASSHGRTGRAAAGKAGSVQTFACGSFHSARSLASATRAPVTCTKTFGGRAYDILVPPNRTCRLTGTAKIAHTVEVDVGGTLIDTGATVGQDVIADGARGIRIAGGSVAHDIAIEATSGAAPGGNAICGVHVGHDLVVADSTKASGVFRVGGIKGCAGNVAAHDIAVQGNVGGAIVARNQAAHNADCELNSSLGGGANKAPRLNTCPRRPL